MLIPYGCTSTGSLILGLKKIASTQDEPYTSRTDIWISRDISQVHHVFLQPKLFSYILLHIAKLQWLGSKNNQILYASPLHLILVKHNDNIEVKSAIISGISQNMLSPRSHLAWTLIRSVQISACCFVRPLQHLC